ncbi:MAG TPA: hypothetical protein VN641_13240 [Urbifossiella sp.]|nr:hypothetical protein [Urbifossiella sp.]
MKRSIRALIIACLGLAISAPASALMIAMKPATERAISAQVVVVGKVTAIEKETVAAAPAPGAKNKVDYKIAVVRIESALAGAANLTHIKVGFIPQPLAAPQPVQPGGARPFIIRRRPLLPELKEGQQYVLFLTKHPDAGFYIMSPMSPPLDPKLDQTKKEVESIKKALTVVADPMKSLKAATASDRAFAATMLVLKYRTHPGGAIEQSPIAAEQSRLILQGLSEADWEKFDRAAPNGMRAFAMLGLTPADGWTPPKPVPVKPGQPAPNYNAVTKQAFVKWLAGPGKDYRIKSYVLKKK